MRLILILILLSSCSNKVNVGYHVYGMEKGMYPRRLLINIGPVILIDEQIVKR